VAPGTRVRGPLLEKNGKDAANKGKHSEEEELTEDHTPHTTARRRGHISRACPKKKESGTCVEEYVKHFT
jgi:hypothetical protein